ncbi:hypothetical protein POM88_015930 [Heracleum sosnowskyi]|uniref:Replication protein A n=1 Tax=Heracleum sosnowskyi TaxID=360622 RepID=A0AAD8MWW3_9APIA|nr:hypothetical protein POM88_015930 [Heracleum sosnowskyi]
MSFYKYNNIQYLDDSTDEWNLRVKSQAIWKGITRQTREFRGYNIIFFDDYSSRIHAFIATPIVEQSRAVRNDQHIYFKSETIFEKDDLPGLKIPNYRFDFFGLVELEAMKNDNRFLTDMVGVIEEVHPKAVYEKDKVTKSHVAVTISDGRTNVNVTFFNDFGDSFLEAYEKEQQKPVIIIIASAKASEWKEALNVTNFPATRFYLNIPHSAVHKLRNRYTTPNFYLLDIDDEDDPSKLPMMKVIELRKLNETNVQNCRMHVFVPAALAEKMSRMIQEGKIYLIKDFQVKEYTELDKYRPVQMDRQIIFTADTKAKKLQESEIFIPLNIFDLFEYGDLKPMET